jgi:hypothetical protein
MQYFLWRNVADAELRVLLLMTARTESSVYVGCLARDHPRANKPLDRKCCINWTRVVPRESGTYAAEIQGPALWS